MNPEDLLPMDRFTKKPTGGPRGPKPAGGRPGFQGGKPWGGRPFQGGKPGGNFNNKGGQGGFTKKIFKKW